MVNSNPAGLGHIRQGFLGNNHCTGEQNCHNLSPSHATSWAQLYLVPNAKLPPMSGWLSTNLYLVTPSTRDVLLPLRLSLDGTPAPWHWPGLCMPFPALHKLSFSAAPPLLLQQYHSTVSSDLTFTNFSCQPSMRSKHKTCHTLSNGESFSPVVEGKPLEWFQKAYLSHNNHKGLNTREQPIASVSQ